MPPKDYVTRSTPRKKRKAAKQRQPIIPVMVLTCIIAFFVWILYSINGASNNQTTALEKALDQSSPSQSKKSDNRPLPVLEKDEYGFPTDLEKSYSTDRLPSGEKIEQQAASEKQYIMQCGSFKSEQQAKEMEAKIAFQGLEAQVRATRGSKGLWYRVYLGPYQKKRQADIDRRSIEQAGIYSCRIWNWNL